MGRVALIINGYPAAVGRYRGRDRPSVLRRGDSHVITQEGPRMVRLFLFDYSQVFADQRIETLVSWPALIAAMMAEILLLAPSFSIEL